MKTLLIFILTLSVSVEAQIKIGNITVSDSLGKAYLIDCFMRPDTLVKISIWTEENYKPKYKPLFTESEKAACKKIDSLNDLNSKIKNMIYLSGTADVRIISDYNEKENRVKKYNQWLESSAINTIQGRGWFRDSSITWYLVPRKPTDTDFIIWFNKK